MNFAGDSVVVECLTNVDTSGNYFLPTTRPNGSGVWIGQKENLGAYFASDDEDEHGKKANATFYAQIKHYYAENGYTFISFPISREEYVEITKYTIGLNVVFANPTPPVVVARPITNAIMELEI